MEAHSKKTRVGFWQKLSARDRLVVGSIATALALLLIFFVGIAPAQKTLSKSRAEHQKLDAELTKATVLGNQITQLKTLTTLAFDASYLALSNTTKEHLPDNAQVALMGDRVHVNISNANAHYVGQWLTAVRNNAKALPVEVKLAAGTPGPNDAGSSVWSGLIVFSLPPKE